MSRIVSPLPPIQVTIEIDPGTGVAQMKASQAMPVETLLKAFEAIKIGIMQERLKDQIGKDQPSASDAIGKYAFELMTIAHGTMYLATLENRLKHLQPAADSPAQPESQPHGAN